MQTCFISSEVHVWQTGCWMKAGPINLPAPPDTCNFYCNILLNSDSCCNVTRQWLQVSIYICADLLLYEIKHCLWRFHCFEDMIWLPEDIWFRLFETARYIPTGISRYNESSLIIYSFMYIMIMLSLICWYRYHLSLLLCISITTINCLL